MFPIVNTTVLGFPGGSDNKKIFLQCGRPGFDPWIQKIPWRRGWLPTPVFLPGELHGQRSLVGYIPWGCKELDTTERLTHTQTYLVLFPTTSRQTDTPPSAPRRLWLQILLGIVIPRQVSISCLVIPDSLWPHGLQPARLLCPWNSPGKNTGVGSHSLF